MKLPLLVKCWIKTQNGLFSLWVHTNDLNKIIAMWKVKTSPLFFFVNVVMNTTCHTTVWCCIPASLANICIYAYTMTQNWITFFKWWCLFWVSTNFLYSLNELFSTCSPPFGKEQKISLEGKQRILILFFTLCWNLSHWLQEVIQHILTAITFMIIWYLIKNICAVGAHITSQFKYHTAHLPAGPWCSEDDIFPFCGVFLHLIKLWWLKYVFLENSMRFSTDVRNNLEQNMWHLDILGSQQ